LHFDLHRLGNSRNVKSNIAEGHVRAGAERTGWTAERGDEEREGITEAISPFDS
jgi:hypothetical protein